MDKTLEQFFTFTTFLEKIKTLERYRGQIYWRDYPTPKNYDSVADHSWRMAMLVLLFADKLSQPFNTDKAVKMALLHDIAECISGDADPLGDGTGKNTHAFNKKLKKMKDEKEKAAAKELFSKLPLLEKKKLQSIWSEYEQRTCFEAKVVKALDRLEALIQVYEWRKGSLFAGHMEFAKNFLYDEKIMDVDPVISQFRDMIMNKMIKDYKEFKK